MTCRPLRIIQIHRIVVPQSVIAILASQLPIDRQTPRRRTRRTDHARIQSGRGGLCDLPERVQCGLLRPGGRHLHWFDRGWVTRHRFGGGVLSLGIVELLDRARCDPADVSQRAHGHDTADPRTVHNSFIRAVISVALSRAGIEMLA